MLLYPFRTVSIGVLRDYIQEWQSPNFHRLEVQPFIWLLLLIILALSFSKKRKKPAEMILLLGFMYLSLSAARNFAIFALVASPVLAKHGYHSIEPYLPKGLERQQLPLRIAKVVNLSLFILFVLLALIKIIIPLDATTNQDAVDSQMPTRAVKFLGDYASPGPLFNSYNWGGYLIWALYPKYLTFVDGRTDLFNDEILTSYLSAWRADPDWERIFKSWGIKIALLEPTAPLSFALQKAGWSVLHEDDRSIILGQDRLP
jgi:hypothetical protein